MGIIAKLKPKDWHGWRWEVPDGYEYECNRPPPYYGFAYEVFYRRTRVYYVMPLNVCAQLWRRVYCWLQRGLTPTAWEDKQAKLLKAVYEKGFKDGQTQALPVYNEEPKKLPDHL